MDDNTIYKVFNTAELILAINRGFLDDLEEAFDEAHGSTAVDIADIIVSNVDQFKAYTPYCLNQTTSMTTMMDIQKDSNLVSFLEARWIMVYDLASCV